MAITVGTTQPGTLLDAVQEGIERGVIQDWALDKAGRFFYTGEAGQWKDHARLRPMVQGLALTLYIEPAGEPVSNLVFGLYQGRFIEMLIAYFGGTPLLSGASATAFALEYDKVSL